MRFLTRIAFVAFLLGLLVVLLVSSGVIPDERIRALPSWLLVLLMVCVGLSGLVSIADAVYHWRARRRTD